MAICGLNLWVAPGAAQPNLDPSRRTYDEKHAPVHAYRYDGRRNWQPASERWVNNLPRELGALR